MSHIIEVKLRFKRKVHLFSRVFSFGFKKVKIGFCFNYRSFLGAYAMNDMDITAMDDLPENERISLIVYGAALEYCRENKLRIFFDKEDILNALLMASMKTNKDIGNAMAHARMPEWLQSVMDSLPKQKDSVKKKN